MTQTLFSFCCFSLCGEKLRDSFHSCLCSTPVPGRSPVLALVGPTVWPSLSCSVPRTAGRQVLVSLPREVISRFCT